MYIYQLGQEFEIITAQRQRREKKMKGWEQYTRLSNSGGEDIKITVL